MVQVAEKINGKVRVIRHVGSAHTDGELAVLHEIGIKLTRPGQGLLDIDIAPVVSLDDVANWTEKEEQSKKPLPAPAKDIVAAKSLTGPNP